jgi:TPR repeat protein
MNVVSTLIGISLIFGLAIAPVQAAAATKAKAEARAGINAKLGAKVKSKPKAKPAKPAKSTKLIPKTASAPKSVALPIKAEPADERSLEAEVAAARQILSANPRDGEARDRLARAAVVLIDILLGAEAVGDTGKAERLVQMLRKDLHDTGWRVQKMSQSGDLKASQATGFLLAHGIFLQKDANKACGEFVAAAEKHPSASWHAAQCLMEALPEKAWENMEGAAQRGHAAALEWMGRRCLGEFGANDKDFACARNHLSASASQGRPRAQTLLAYLLASGQGGEVDLPRAIRLYKLAAEHGDADAQNNLGEIYEMGRGTDRNLEEALRWYERAAAGGLGSAQFNAGRLWAIGAGERKDPTRARALLVQAEGNGITQARQVLDWLDRQSPPASAAPSDKSPVVAGDETKKD